MREIRICISFILIMMLMACTQEEKEEVVLKQDSTYAIQYFVKSDSAYIWYNTHCLSREHYVTDWDTSFFCQGGWCINVMVTSFNCSCIAGILVNGDTLDGCSCGDWCLMGFYLD